jgi:Fe-S-cluster containining protein
MPHRSRARRQADAALDRLYASIPALDCKGLCRDSCGPIAMTGLEEERMVEARGGPLPPHTPHPLALQAISCPLLTAEGRCSVYHARPAICRLWGAVDHDLMRCPHGCRPEPRPLTERESRAVLRRPRRSTPATTRTAAPDT